VDSVTSIPNLDPSDGRFSAAQPRLRRYRRATAVLWTIVIMVLCWLPRAAIHKLEYESTWFKLPNFDKVVHAGIFVVFSLLWVRVWASPRQRLWAILGGFGLAVLTEVGQLVPAVGRDASVADGLTDCAGVLLGIAVAPLLEPLARRIETSIFRKTGDQSINSDELSAAPGQDAARPSR
jgi:VanZ family protein